MDLLLQLQDDITDKLNSESALAVISVQSLRRLVIAQEVAKRLPHLTAKGGRFGCGALVNMPTIEGMLPNVFPPFGDVVSTIDVIENPELNFDPATGTQITCEQAARTIRLLLHQFGIEPSIMLYQDQSAIEPILDPLWQGCCGYRVKLRGRLQEAQTTRCAVPAIAEGPPLTITLSVLDGSTIFYTTDGTFPGPGNAGAIQYAGPFAVVSGTNVRYATYLPGNLGSNAAQSTIN